MIYSEPYPNIYNGWRRYEVTLTALCKKIFARNSGKNFDTVDDNNSLNSILNTDSLMRWPRENSLSWWFDFVNGSYQISILRGRPTFRLIRDAKSISCEKKKLTFLSQEDSCAFHFLRQTVAKFHIRQSCWPQYLYHLLLL